MAMGHEGSGIEHLCPEDAEARLGVDMSSLGRLPSQKGLKDSTAGRVRKNQAGLNQGVQKRVFLQLR